jgi:chemotaxis protein methyltransferase CheR
VTAATRPAAEDTLARRDFEYTREDFARVRRLIHGRVGIALNESKQDMVYNRLAKRLRALRLESFVDYLALLEDPSHAEWQQFVNALTTNLSHFFREAHHFAMLVDHCRALGRTPLRIWSAAASTGEEPYSIAMTLCEAYGGAPPPASVLATDIDTTVLATAEQGVYPLDRVEQVSPERLKRFFLRGTGANAGFARVRPEVARLVQYRVLNLTEPRWDLGAPFDAIFCRNVMIYFDKKTQYAVLERMARVIRPDGLLFAGHSESFLHAADLFQSIGKTVYRPAVRK